MRRTAKELRKEAEQQRASGKTFASIAKHFAAEYSLNPRVALRLAHGLTQAQVADRWNELWPDSAPKTAKQISYWEIWPESGGRAPSLETLNRLAQIYQCSAGDLLGGEDHSGLDTASEADPPDVDAGQVLTVAIAVVRRGIEVLLVCRREESGAGSWQFPAGVVKPQADPAAVAVAETLTETGVHCIVARYLGTRLHPVTRVDCRYYLCDHLAGEPVNGDPVENAAVTWAPSAEIHRFIPRGMIFEPVVRALEDGEAV